MIPAIALDARDPRPLYVQIADALATAIERGELAPDERLPAIRTLAHDLDVALVTVSQAYETLAARGRVTSRAGRGTFVTARGPHDDAPFARTWEPSLGRFARGERMEGVMERLAEARVPGVISLASAHPAPETFPMAEFARAMQRTFADDKPELMQYRASTGDPDLCATLAEGLAARGCDAGAGEIIVTSGAQQAADLIASVLLTERAVVASESPTYPGTLGVFDARGVSYVEVRSDADGVRIDDVERVFAEYRPRLFSICPIAENPTGTVLPARRGRAIVELARRYDVVVLEDQTGWTFAYDAAAPPPLAAYDPEGRVVMMESLSKSIFPALRIGYLRVKGALRDSIEAAKVRTDSFTSTLTQRALWRYLRAPAYPRHLKSARGLYRHRRDLFVEALALALPWAEVAPPQAGTNVWLRLPQRLSTQAAFERCAREGVLVMPADPFYPTRTGPPALRLSFGDLQDDALREAAQRLGRALA
ncbi:transcriptional regulator [Vulcanimicrobium alpinum]|uniref:Transcriptional regulator n=1 Tax=Vulcanimicrobium alpinum TaxID=3016050 RepID=A0AAN1XU70_UNVUL|nr:PLP-dependent aminotransferase family protein [Vulcanimicrobium alpinum]BDE05630.1 transcriptional regulator [Vulcanimicrobium alpinum]